MSSYKKFMRWPDGFQSKDCLQTNSHVVKTAIYKNLPQLIIDKQSDNSLHVKLCHNNKCVLLDYIGNKLDFHIALLFVVFICHQHL